MTNKHSDKAKGAGAHKARKSVTAASTKEAATATAELDVSPKSPRTVKPAGQRAMVASSTRPDRTPTSAGPSTTAKPNQEPHRTKSALLHEMVRSADGASLARLIVATGWQAHTVRAALSGLRKKGVVLERTRVGQNTIYRCASRSAPAGSSAEAGSALDTGGGDDGSSATGHRNVICSSLAAAPDQ